MSVRTDDMDVHSAIKRLSDALNEAEYSYGDRQPDVEAALQILVGQVEEAAKSIEAAFLRNQIDIAERMKRAAEERIAELGKVVVA